MVSRCFSIFILILFLFLPNSNLFSQETTFFKVYESSLGSMSVRGYHFVDSQGRIFLSDVLRSSLISVDNSGTMDWQKRYSNILYTNIISLKDGEFGITALGIGITSSLIYGVFDSSFNPKFLKAISLNYLTNVGLIGSAFSLMIFDKLPDGYLATLLSDEDDLAFLAKLNFDGSIRWIKRYELAEDHHLYGDPKKVSEGVYIISGGLSVSEMFSAVKFDASGNVWFAKAYKSKNSLKFKLDWSEDIYPTPDGKYVLVGTGYDYSTGRHVAVVIKIDENANLIFAKMIGIAGKNIDEANNIRVLPDGKLIISGFIDSAPYLIALDSQGNFLWGKKYNTGAYGGNVYSLEIVGNSITFAGSLCFYQGFSPKCGIMLAKTDLNGRIASCYIVEDFTVNVKDVTSEVEISNLPVIVRDVSFPPISNFSLNLTNGDYYVREICSGGIVQPILERYLFLGIGGEGSVYIPELNKTYGFNNYIPWVITVTNGTKLTLIASPSENFSYWAYECYYCGNNTTCQVEMNRDKRCAAIFKGGNGSSFYPFSDVPPTHWAYNAIVWFRERGITTGYEDNTFHPDEFVTRGAMAAFFIRLLEHTDDPVCEGGIKCKDKEPYFSDVDRNNPFYAHIQRLKELGITKGYDDGTYRPEESITRQAMAAFLVRAKEGTDEPICQGGIPCSQTTPYFQDVPQNHPFFRHIQRLKELGITKGCNPPESTLFCPDKPVTRAEMAVFLCRMYGNCPK